MSSRRLWHGRRGRAALAWAAGVFVSVQLTAGLFLDYVWPDVRSDWYANVEGLFRSQPEKPDVLCLGSSRFGAGLQLPEMRAAFREELGDAAPHRIMNAAVPGGDAVSSDYWLRRLLREGARPKLVVVEVAPDTVNGYNSWVGLHICRQMRWPDVPSYLPDAWQSHNFARLVCDRLAPLYYYRRELRALVLDPPRAPPDEEGCTADWLQMLQTRQPLGDAAAAAAAAEGSRACMSLLDTKLAHFHIGGLTDAALERLLARCRRNHIDAVLVGVPVSSYLRELYTPPIDAAYRDYMARLCRTYGCRFVDWRDRAPDEDFVDIHHLRYAGGLRFSRLLTREVLAPACREAHGGGNAP